ncbi:Ryanodine receptor 1 [Aix galericulata]|nr:Ryanodine receptor 1 [Aix galericulata]
MELSERLDLLRFQWHTLKLYCAVCALGNNRVAHALCSHVDQAQLLFAIESPELPGPLRAGYYDLLLAMHLDAAQRARASMSAEFIIPMTEATKSITLFPPGSRTPGPPGVGPSACLRPQPHFAEPCFVLAAGGGRAPLSPGEQVPPPPGPGTPTGNGDGDGDTHGDVPRNVPKAVVGVGDMPQGTSGPSDHPPVPPPRSTCCCSTRRGRTRRSAPCPRTSATSCSTSTTTCWRTAVSPRSPAPLTPPVPPPSPLTPPRAPPGIELEGEEEEEEEETSLRHRLLGLVQKVVGLRKKAPEEEAPPEEPPVPSTLQELISQTMVHWAQESFIQSPELVRAMFSLLHRQYDGLGELVRALPKAYTISAHSVADTTELLECLGQIRSLLIVQMGPEEENLMIQSIGCAPAPTGTPGSFGHPRVPPTPQSPPGPRGQCPGAPPSSVTPPMCPPPRNIMNNKVFYQHPNLMRALGMHETVMQVMVSVLGGGESKVVTYLASCGLQSCPMLLSKGYPDIGWNPCGGERYLDFLRFAVFVNVPEPQICAPQAPIPALPCTLPTSSPWVPPLHPCTPGSGHPQLPPLSPKKSQHPLPALGGSLTPPVPAGESVEENANVVVRLLIRRPECFGPALRGEGGSGLLAAIEDAIKISEDPARDGPTVKKDRRRELCVGRGGTGTSSGTGTGTGMEMGMGTPPVGAPRGCWGRTDVPVWGRGAARGEPGAPGQRHHVLLRRPHRPAGPLRPRDARRERGYGGAGGVPGGVPVPRSPPHVSPLALLLQLIQAGKGEALRIRAILRSLVPLDDLVGIISLPLQIPTFGKGGRRGERGARSRGGGDAGATPAPMGAVPPPPSDGNLVEPRMSASFVPDHKAPMVLFLDRVYGIETQEFLLRLLEVGFLPDMRAAASLDTVSRGARGPPQSAPAPLRGFGGPPVPWGGVGCPQAPPVLWDGDGIPSP